MKFNARYLLVILLLALLGCSMFTCKMVEGLTGATDQAVDPKTLNLYQKQHQHHLALFLHLLVKFLLALLITVALLILYLHQEPQVM